MLRKITRIFLKTLGALLLILFLSGVALYFGVQSYTFQTWLGHKASAWLSKELKSEVSIKKINLDFFSKAALENVLVLDKHQDTLLYANLLVNIKHFDYKHQSFTLEKITLKNAVSKIVKYKGEKEFNYGFIEDYFASDKKDTALTSSQGWDIKFGDVVLENVAFTYRYEKYDQTVSQNMNYDNIVVSQIFGTISKFRLEGDTILADIKNLRAKEQCGIELKNLTTNVTLSQKQLLCENMRLTTPYSFVRGTLNFLYHEWEDYYDFIDKVNINSTLQDSTNVSFRDIAFFAEELNGLQETVLLTGKVKGLIKDMSLQNVKLTYGAHTHFSGNMNLRGLPDVEKLYLYFDAKKLSTNYSDVIRIPDYPFYENKKLKLPLEIERLGVVSYRGKFDGLVTDFSIDGIFNTQLGSAGAKVSVKTGEKAQHFSYKGNIETQSFNLGTLLGQRDFNALSMNCEINGKGANLETAEANLKGEISNINIHHYNYKNIAINGAVKNKLFTGSLNSKDPNADFDFNGTVDFYNKIPDMHFICIIRSLKPKELHFTNSGADSGVVSSKVFINVTGDNIDNLSGFAVLDSTVYKTKTQTYSLKDFNIKLEQSTADKNITLKSAYLNASMKGKFLLSNLQPAIQSFLFTYYPTFFKKRFSETYTDEFNFNVKIKRFDAIHDLFLTDVMLSPNTELTGGFNAREQKLYAQANSDKLSYKNFTVHQFMLFVDEQDSIVKAEVFGNALNFSDSLALDNFNFKLNSIDESLNYGFNWDNYISPRNKGKIQGGLFFEHADLTISCDTLNVLAHDSLWTLIKPSSVVIKKDRSLTVNTFSLHCNRQTIDVAGTLSDKAGDNLVINTHNLILQEFNPLLKDYDLSLEGLMNSELTLSNTDKNFVFDGDLNVSKLRLNDNTIGFLFAKTTYNNVEKTVEMNGYTSLGLQDGEGNQIKNISFNGNYFTQKEEESIDVDFKAEPANLKLLNPFLKDILTINHAFVNGSGKIHGTPKEIKLDGAFRLFNSEVKVDYTNVTYNVVGDVEVMPDQIRFSDLLVKEKGSKAATTGTVNGNIFHSNFDRIRIDYDVNFKNMLTLNTTVKENNLYYGKVYATGNMGIYGFVNNLHMEINATTNKNSKFVLPLDGPAEIDSDNGFIHFVKKDKESVAEEKEEKALSGFDLKMRVNATPDATTQIVMDGKTGDMLTVQGVGNLDLRINTLGKFEMFGDYFITNGDYIFTLENVMRKKFEIDGGSSISWSGDPVNAEINVATSYRQRVSIAPLLNDTVSKTRTPVDCKLLISDKLFSPEMKFAIDFPNIEATAKSRIDNILSDDVEMNRQVFSLLLFRMFVTPQIYNSAGGGVATSAGNAATSTGSELLSNRLSEFMNTYFGNLMGLKNLQMGVNYRAATQTNNQAVDLTLSQQFFDNKLSVDGNFGMNNTASNGSSNLIGDVVIEYKLSDDGRYRLKAFNRSNDNTQIINMGGPNTQGVGFFYRREFDTLFKKKKKKEGE